jgi:hypothetical protein
MEGLLLRQASVACRVAALQSRSIRAATTSSAPRPLLLLLLLLAALVALPPLRLLQPGGRRSSLLLQALTAVPNGNSSAVQASSQIDATQGDALHCCRTS